MKKTLVLAVVFVMALGTAAFARGHGFGGGHNGGGHGGCGYYNDGGYGAGYNCPNGGNGNCGMYGFGMGNGMGGGNMQMPAPAEPSVKSNKEAEALVQKFVTENYKGYKVATSESFTAPRGTAYKVTVNDAGGNTFVFHVNPWGNVRGPFLNK